MMSEPGGGGGRRRRSCSSSVGKLGAGEKKKREVVEGETY